MVSLARKNLFHDRLRFVITVAGVAFAVTLVLVQVGLFMGLLDKATVTIRNARADIWITSRNTPNVDFAHVFPETVVLRARGVDGVERADNLILAFGNIQLPSGATEGSLVYALEVFSGWNLPWRVTSGTTDDLRRGYNVLMDGSAALRYGPFAVGDEREIQGRRYRIVGTTGQAHAQTFEVECAIAALSLAESGRGRSRRAAEQEAARRLLDALKASDQPGGPLRS